MKITNARKVGFWAALAIGLDSIIGIGMFVKNYAVTSNVGQQGVGILITWIIGAVIAITMLVSYLEVFRIKTVKVHGMAAFAERCIGPKFGYFVRFNLPFFYMPIFQLAMGFYASEFFFNGLGYLLVDPTTGIKPAMPPIYIHVIIGLVLVLFFQIVNFYSAYSGGLISILTVSIKFVPIILAIFAGFILWKTNNVTGRDTNLDMELGVNWFTNTNNKPLNINGILMSAPSILFAYDQFLSGAASREKIEGGQKTVSKLAVIILMIVSVVYTLVSAAQILHGTTSIPRLLASVFPHSQFNTWSGVGRLFISAAAVGSLNFFCHSNAVVTEQAIRSETFLGVLDLREKISVRLLSFIYYMISLFVWIMIILVPSIVLETDEIMDEASNMPSLFFFAIYAITLFGYAWNRDRIKVKRINNFAFWACFVISEILIAIIIVYQTIYANVVYVLINPHANSIAGLLNDKNVLVNWRFFIIYLFMIIFFIAMPIINALFIKRLENRHVYSPTQDNQLQVLEWDENYEATETEEFDIGWQD